MNTTAGQMVAITGGLEPRLQAEEKNTDSPPTQRDRRRKENIYREKQRLSSGLRMHNRASHTPCLIAD
ncbi:hypothetical protein PAMP_003031 [Pampus punctatissimus]